ncbi:threonine/serine dehydratase [Pontixanthobacter gangjinensis]|uniref:Pyridoxal-phosphate dependent enzyme n=1 Tax=Pontixanthobacter gangjinensis TaxID=1028742 RepID=A0A6I4SQB1_9SPHN|nr:pyridoxal-phosphate dependent enzyme [Pontixanthobacter gangjinensis]MXO57246.1 pyridoxal-phosphate dependent enzyme [Pontixanthobacter gangjinensis]
MSEQRKPTHEGVLLAAQKIASILPPTPLLPVWIGDVRCWVKVESLQPIGAFKIRGGWHRLSALTEAERSLGIVAVSSGNHAQGVAWAAKRLAIKATIVMPRDAPKVKLDATRALGADIVLYDRPGEDRDAVAARIIARTGAILVHAFADPWVIEGQGSAGIEATAQLGRQPSRLIVCCGGGGLTAGLSLACPEAEVVPVEPVGWDMVGQALEKGEIVKAAADAPKTICDALQPTATGEIVLSVLQGRSQPGVSVTDAEVRTAQRFAFSHLQLVLEPGGAAALAAALAGKVTLDEHTVILLTGGNTDAASFGHTIQIED